MGPTVRLLILPNPDQENADREKLAEYYNVSAIFAAQLPYHFLCTFAISLLSLAVD